MISFNWTTIVTTYYKIQLNQKNYCFPNFWVYVLHGPNFNGFGLWLHVSFKSHKIRLKPEKSLKDTIRPLSETKGPKNQVEIKGSNSPSLPTH